MSGSSSSNGGGGFGAKFEHFLYSGDKKHVVAGMAIIGSLFGVPWYFMNRGVCHSAEKDYYDLLGVSKDASREEIKKAFHALAKKYHLDANKNNPSTRRKFQEIRDAYEVNSDSARS
nr:chaperone protein DnaJ 1, mitochondrial isoform X2 [Ipomoea batatas]GMD82285.1 chaperone protein DnaJ 1, mitochondrial isoform X2 [Ipomoea batatas]